MKDDLTTASGGDDGPGEDGTVEEEGHFATWQAPYASASAIEDALARRVARRVADPVTATTLIEELGITPGHSPRIVNGLRCLGFLNREGYYTNRFYDFATASDDDVRYQVMQEAIKEAYAPVFQRLGDNLSNVLHIQIVEAFGRARPESQRARMVPTFKQLAMNYGLITTAAGRAATEFSGSVNRMLLSATLGQDDSGEDLGSVTLQVAARLSHLDPRTAAFLNTMVREMQLWVTGEWKEEDTLLPGAVGGADPDNDALVRAIVRALREAGSIVATPADSSATLSVRPAFRRGSRASGDAVIDERLPPTVAAKRNQWLQSPAPERDVADPERKNGRRSRRRPGESGSE